MRNVYTLDRVREIEADLRQIDDCPSLWIAPSGKVYARCTGVKTQTLVYEKSQLGKSQQQKFVRVGSRNFLVKVLVALAYIPRPDGALHVRHKNSDLTDNRADNLEWSFESELIRKDSTQPSKLSDEQAAAIRERYFAGGITMHALASKYGVTKQAISQIIAQQTHKRVRS